MSQTLPALALMGVPGSPYTRKMLAVLRYRRIPYRLLLGSQGFEGYPQTRVRLLPTFYFPTHDGGIEAVTDSTPLIRRLEADYGGRTVIPPDPALAFIDALVEDFGDEWLTKAMFHYRWSYPEDIRKAGYVLPCWSRPDLSNAALDQAAAMISERQISRLRYVGSNPSTGPLIEAGYRRFLEIFEAILRQRPYLFGRRPASADFALYGQLTQLAHFDPTPMALALEIAPRLYAWVGAMEDLSGLEPKDGDFDDLDALAPSLGPLIAELGRGYAPLMIANAAAVAGGGTSVELEIDGHHWSQQPFPYQAKCLGWLRADFAKLAPDPKAKALRLLQAGGCGALISG